MLVSINTNIQIYCNENQLFSGYLILRFFVFMELYGAIYFRGWHDLSM